MSNTTEGTKIRAKRYQAKKHLDEWNDITGFIEPDTGYYFELLSVMEDGMQEYAQSQLQELRERVEGLKLKNRYISRKKNQIFNKAISDVLNLIDQLQED